jgi:hypothetical protein
MSTSLFLTPNGAGEGIRTLDIHLGKVVLYQLSYARILLFISLYITNLASIGKFNDKFA